MYWQINPRLIDWLLHWMLMGSRLVMMRSSGLLSSRNTRLCFALLLLNGLLMVGIFVSASRRSSESNVSSPPPEANKTNFHVWDILQRSGVLYYGHWMWTRFQRIFETRSLKFTDIWRHRRLQTQQEHSNLHGFLIQHRITWIYLFANSNSWIVKWRREYHQAERNISRQTGLIFSHCWLLYVSKLNHN